MAAGAIPLIEALEPVVAQLVPIILGLFKKHAPSAPADVVNIAATAMATHAITAVAEAQGAVAPPQAAIQAEVTKVIANPPPPALTEDEILEKIRPEIEAEVERRVADHIAALPAPASAPVAGVQGVAPRATGVIFHGSSARPDFS